MIILNLLALFYTNNMQVLENTDYKLINKTNEQNRIRDVEMNKLTVSRGETGGGQQGKEGEGASKGTRIEDSQAQTIRDNCGSGGWGRGEHWGKSGTTVTEQ